MYRLDFSSLDVWKDVESLETFKEDRKSNEESLTDITACLQFMG